MRHTPCDEAACVSTIGPAHLSISVQGYPSVRVVFTEAEDTRKILRTSSVQTIHDASERPILLRGFASRRNPTPHEKRIVFPVAGTLYQDNGVLELEVAIGHINRYDPSRLVVARTLLDPSGSDTVARGRAIHPSSRAFVETTCGNHGAKSITHHRAHSESRATINQMGAPKILHIGTHFDRQFMKAIKCKTPSQCNNRILGIFNQASVPYRRQLGVQLRVGLQYGPVTFTSGTTDSSVMLDNYQALIESSHARNLHDGVNQAGALVDGFAAFTGQKMRDKVAGIATLATFCDNTRTSSASMVVRHTSSAINPSVVAHELGHNLAAYHSYGGIMAPKVSTKSAKKLRFTSDSISEISGHLNGWYSECREGTTFTPPPGFGSTLELTVSRSQEYHVSVGLAVTKRRANCDVVVKAGETSSGASTGTTIFRAPMEASGMSRGTTMSYSIDTTAESEATVYFKAFYVCSGEEVVAESSVISYVPNYGPSPYSPVSRSEWITQLESLLNW